MVEVNYTNILSLKELLSDVSSRISTRDRQLATHFRQDDIFINADYTNISYLLETFILSSIAESGIITAIVDHQLNDAQLHNISIRIQGIDAVAISAKESLDTERRAIASVDKCKKLVESMGGTITTAHNREYGTKFDFNFTAAKSNLEDSLLTKYQRAKCDGIIELLKTFGKNGQLMAALDWSTTPLGSLETWPQSLLTTTSICLKSPFPMLIWWGPQLTMVYNEGYNTLIAAKHPKAMGQAGLECWWEIKDIMGPMLNEVMHGSGATWSEDQMFPLERNGFTEECYFTFAMSAIHDETNEACGVFTAGFETTKTVIDKRRLNVLKEMGRATAAKTMHEAYQIIGTTVSSLPSCLPFCVFYSVLNGRFVREFSCGISEESEVCPAELKEGSLWPYEEVVATCRSLLVEDLADRFGPIICPPWSDQIKKAMIVPLFSNKQSRNIIGLCIIGISARLHFNGEYASFIESVGDRICDILSMIQSYVDQVHRAEELVRIDNAKTQFFTNISHEFRTPLALMLGPLADSLADMESPLTDPQRRRQQMIQNNAVRLLKLVNNVLDFARIEAGRTQLNLVPVNLAQLTQNLCGTFQSLITQAGLDFNLDIQQVSSIHVDVDMWEKIVLNLLSNAFKFTHRGSISVNLQQKDGNIVFSVADSGVGIETSEQQKVFQRFHRAKNSRGRSFEGSGIGLALVQELVKLHNGDISFQSQVNQGTTFTIILPIVSTNEFAHLVLSEEVLSPRTFNNSQAAINEVSKWESHDEYEGDTQSLGHSARPHVLLVDDNVDMRSYISGILSPHYRVTLAKDGIEALEVVEKDSPDLILSDVMMPRLDGFGLIKRLRSLEKSTNTPIIVLSARAGEEAKVEGLEIGADDYLVKTAFSEKELLARVKTHFELGQLRVHLEQEVARKTEQLTRANTVLSEFIDMICHEIRNPLHGIVGSWQLLSDHLVTLSDDAEKTKNSNSVTELSEMKNLLVNIKECTTYQTRVMDEVVLLAKLFANKFEVQSTRCVVNKLIDKTIRSIEANAMTKNIKFVRQNNIQEETLDIDSRCVKQILNSLTTFVMDVANIDSVVHVHLSSCLIGDNNVELKVQISTTNFTVDEDTFNQLITLQHQSFANRSVGIHYNNTGFSLAISEGLVKVMGGQISVVSGGLAFSVTGKKSLIKDEDPLPQSNRIFTKRALVAEDNYVNQVLCRALLRKQGYECHIASNGREALEKYRPNYYDFILMDIAMPEINGLDVTKQIRQIEANNNVQCPVFVIGLSAYAQAEKVAEAFEAGMNDFISKPATLDKIIGIIKRYTKKCE